jgi:hypothetical protein
MTDVERHRDPRCDRAIAELQELIKTKYPGASFAVRAGIDDPEETWLSARVDVDDPDEVMDVVVDRMLELQLDEGIPVYVLPLRTLERAAALREQVAAERRNVSSLPRALPVGH